VTEPRCQVCQKPIPAGSRRRTICGSKACLSVRSVERVAKFRAEESRAAALWHAFMRCPCCEGRLPEPQPRYCERAECQERQRERVKILKRNQGAQIRKAAADDVA
jgi:hypothetical protein